MSTSTSETARISAEFERRAREIPADFYSWGKPANLLKHQQTVRSCIGLLQQASLFPLDGCRIADIGCGAGFWLLEFMQWGAHPANLAGIDLMPKRLELARRRVPQADLHLGCASQLPWPDQSFDLVTQFLVFTSILDEPLKRTVAREMLRILKPGGAILWFDFRFDNPRNHQVGGIREPEIRALFPGCTVRLVPTLLAMPLSRRIAGWSWPLAAMLGSIPFLCTHYAGLIQKN